MSYVVPFEVRQTTYAEAAETLEGALRFGIDPSLEPVEAMLAELGNPDEAFESVQIAGTNGKTSTARYTAAILAGEGRRVGLYTSPELVSLTERVEVGGRPVGEAAFARGVAAADEAGRRVNARRAAAGERPYDVTQFDLLTVGAVVAFAEAGIDVAVLECGMGGRWDATSAVRGIQDVAVTGIGLDHTRILGDTLEKIAAEKAAIIKPGRGCVLGVGTATPDSVEDVFLAQCEEAGVDPTLVRPVDLADAAGEMQPGEPRDHADLAHAFYQVTKRPSRIGDELSLDVMTEGGGPTGGGYRGLAAAKPAYQAANIACAVTLAELYLGHDLDEDRLRASVASCPTPGRFDLVQAEPPVLVDACHNPQGVATFLASVRSMAPAAADRPALLCGVLEDKDVDGIVSLLAPEFPVVYVTQTSSPRALPADQLAGVFRKHGVTPRDVFPSVGMAVEALAGTSYVACGSITTAGEVAAILRPGVQGASEAGR